MRNAAETPFLSTERPSIGASAPDASGRITIYRHDVLVRVTHWLNALFLVCLLMSGLQIFNAHPRLYWGVRGVDDDSAFLSIEAQPSDHGLRGITRISGMALDTTGVLGVSKRDGEVYARAFPAWLTIPSYQGLALGRLWHFFFAWLFVLNGLVYLGHGALSGHIRCDLLPTREQMRHIGRTVWEHVRLRFPKREEAKRYNVLQKLSYLGVVLVLLPLMLLTGLCMSPGIDAAFPWLPDLFSGRQSARTIHFLSAALIVAFVAVHLLMVLLSGVVNNLRSMITGQYVVEPEEPTR